MNIKKNLKAYVAAVGATLTAASTAWAVVANAYADSGFGLDDVSPILTAVVLFGGTVYGVWKATNAPQ